jgi:hypothetical protein
MTQFALTARELEALRLLERKHSGDPVAFINISDARALTELGLATRSRQGWDITADGVARLRSEPETAKPDDPPAPERGATIVGRWRYLRALLIEQLDALEAGGLQIRADDVDIGPHATATLRREIAEFDVLIAADEAAAEA